MRLDVVRYGPLTLKARGNTFAGPTDCSLSPGTIVRGPSCSGGIDLGVVPDLGTTTPTVVTVDVAGCN